MLPDVFVPSSQWSWNIDLTTWRWGGLRRRYGEPEMLTANLKNCFVGMDFPALHLVEVTTFPSNFFYTVLTKNVTSDVCGSSNASLRES